MITQIYSTHALILVWGIIGEALQCSKHNNCCSTLSQISMYDYRYVQQERPLQYVKMCNCTRTIIVTLHWLSSQKILLLFQS